MTPDRAELDRLYNNRALVTEHPQIIAGWAETSQAVRERLDVRLDLAYGPHPRQRLDLFPAGPDAPLLVFLHGGYWQSLSKDSFSLVAPGFVAAGIAVAVVGYALCPEVTMTALTAQVADAVAWVHRKTQSPIFVSGHSAGGHLAAWLAATDRAGVIQGAVGISGLYDLEPIRLCYVNDKLHMDQAEAARLSPIRHIPDRAPPLVLAVGADETAAYHAQQADFFDAWTSRGLQARIVPMPGHNHFSIAGAFADPASALHQATRQLIGR